jgi:hypothetical protein
VPRHEWESLASTYSNRRSMKCHARRMGRMSWRNGPTLGDRAGLPPRQASGVRGARQCWDGDAAYKCRVCCFDGGSRGHLVGVGRVRDTAARRPHRAVGHGVRSHARLSAVDSACFFGGLPEQMKFRAAPVGDDGLGLDHYRARSAQSWHHRAASVGLRARAGAASTGTSPVAGRRVPAICRASARPTSRFVRRSRTRRH